jgi:hypothetical protein
MHIRNRLGWHDPSLIYYQVSYFGFLLDRLFTLKDSIATETTRYIGELIDSHNRRLVCGFLAEQIRIRTNLPDVIVRQLALVAADPAVDGETRAITAMGLVEVSGHRDTGLTVLASLAENPALLIKTSPRVDVDVAVAVARKLVGMEGYKEAGVTLFTRLTKNPSVWGFDRTEMAQELSRIEGCENAGAILLAYLAKSSNLERGWRRKAVDVNGHVVTPAGGHGD